MNAAPGTPAEFTRFILAEEKKWVPIIKRANIKEMNYPAPRGGVSEKGQLAVLV